MDANDVMLKLGTVRGAVFGDVFALEVLESYVERDGARSRTWLLRGTGVCSHPGNRGV